MPEPVAWQIMENVRSSLGNIATSGGYFYTITSVVYASECQDEFKTGNLYLSLDAITEAEAYSNGKTDWFMSLSVSAIIARGNTPADQAVLRLWSDVQKAIMADPKRNSLAHDTTMQAPSFQDTADKRTGVDIPIQIRYRTSETDPTSL